MTTTTPPAKRRRSRSTASRRRKRSPETPAVATPDAPAAELLEATVETEPAVDVPAVPEEVSVPDAPLEFAVPTVDPEVGFVARAPEPAPPRPFPATRHGVFFDVENTSRAEHVARVLEVLALDWVARGTELIAVGNWRVIGHETARLLARHGAQLVHSAPSVGVRDWSDLRIAVGAGCWLAGARPGDVLQIVTDDQAFDAVGDVAASLGVRFQRLSYRALSGALAVAREEEPREAIEPRSGARRSRRGGRGGRGRRGRPEGSSREMMHSPVTVVAEEAPPSEAHTAPHDEILTLVHELLAASPGGINLDTLSNALKGRGFRRPAGSPRLITRIHRIKELVVSPGNLIQLADGSVPAPVADVADEIVDSAPAEGESATGPEGEKRRRRRRGGRRRRGRGRSAAGGEGTAAAEGSNGEPGDASGDSEVDPQAIDASAATAPAISDPMNDGEPMRIGFEFDPSS